MNKDALLELRQQIVDSARTVVVDGDGPAEERLPIILELARGSQDVALLQKAYELAGQIEDKAARMDALLDVLAEVDGQLVELDSPEEGDEQGSDFAQTQD
jgi:hypothetical protein